jgi:CRP-like cAMP-binding protein
MLAPLIKKLQLFLPVPGAETDWLNGLVTRVDEFRAHTDIVGQEEVPAGIFIILAGHACCYKIVSDGGRQILDFMFPGDMTELHGSLLQATDHGIVALGPTTIARLDQDRLIREISDHPAINLACCWSALQQTAILRERIAVIVRRNAHARIAHLLCEMFERLCLVGETTDPLYELPITQVELADALGISDVHVNRMLRRLERERLIQADHRTIRIPDLSALKAAAALDGRYLHLEGAPTTVRDRVSAGARF